MWQRIRVVYDQRGKPTLNHEHDQAGAKTVACDISNAEPAAIARGADVVIVTPHRRSGNHLRGNLQTRHHEFRRQDRMLDRARNLDLLA